MTEIAMTTDQLLALGVLGNAMILGLLAVIIAMYRMSTRGQK